MIKILKKIVCIFRGCKFERFKKSQYKCRDCGTIISKKELNTLYLMARINNYGG